MLYEQEAIEYIVSLPDPNNNYIRVERYTEVLNRILNCIFEKSGQTIENGKTASRVIDAYNITNVEELKTVYNKLVEIVGNEEYIDNSLITCRITDKDTKEKFYEIRSLLCQVLDMILSEQDKQYKNYFIIRAWADDPKWNYIQYTKELKQQKHGPFIPKEIKLEQIRQRVRNSRACKEILS